MTTARLLMWTAVAAALILPTAGWAQTTYAPPYDPEAAPPPPGSEAMIPYASDQPSSPPPEYGQGAYSQPGYSQPDTRPSDYDQSSQDRDYSRRTGVHGDDDRVYAPDPGRADQGRDDERFYDGRRDAEGDRGHYGPVYGYPQFRGVEQRIRDALAERVRGDILEPDDASDLIGQLRRIQQQESREYRVHGADLPSGDEAFISDQLSDLDRRVDRIRR